MIVNPYKNRELVVPFAGTRLLQQEFGVVGATFLDPQNSARVWQVQSLYEPIEGRAIGGIRAKLRDQKGFITFCNQMDLEVLLGVACPGMRCSWSGKTYAAADDRDFYGLIADEEDLVDDLYDRELLIRGCTPTGILDQNMEFIRRVHLEDGQDVEEYFIVTWDGDPETGICPDIRFETVQKRWARVERMKVRWEFTET